jgi:ABC-2 type transport system permease protein
MPRWAQYIAAMNPPSYFIEMIRAVYIKGSTLGDMLPSIAKLGAFAVGFNALAILSYRKRSS